MVHGLDPYEFFALTLQKYSVEGKRETTLEFTLSVESLQISVTNDATVDICM
jgi:hypothetical protein